MKLPRVISQKEKLLEEREPPSERTHRFIEKIGRETIVEGNTMRISENKNRSVTTMQSSIPTQSSSQKQESFFSKVKRWFRF